VQILAFEDASALFNTQFQWTGSKDSVETSRYRRPEPSLTTATQPAGRVITASSGYHGQSFAYAARTFGTRAVILMPEVANPDKVEAMANLGAEIIFHGRDFDDARVKAEQIARDQGLYYVHPANEPLLIAGVGTIGLEILEDLPDVQTIIVPIGAGSVGLVAVVVGLGAVLVAAWRAGRPAPATAV
jgi:threonine dehydratase